MIVVGSLSIALSSCAVRMASYEDISGTNWILTGIPGEPLEQLERPVNIKFNNGTIEGFLGCNNYTGKMELKDNEVKFSEIMGTMKSCTHGSATENKVARILRLTNRIVVKDNKLRMMDGKKVLAEFEPEGKVR